MYGRVWTALRFVFNFQMEFSDECIFNETIEATNYNKYSSSKYSNERRTFYLALNRRGQSRKVMIKAKQQLGKLSSYTRVLTRSVSSEELQLRHHHQCSAHRSQVTDPPRCRKKKKKKKKKRKFDEIESETKRQINNNNNNSGSGRVKCESVNVDASSADECQRDLINTKNVKAADNNNNNNKKVKNSNKKKKKNINHKQRKRLDQVEVPQENTTMVPTTPSPEELFNDEDYAMESSTHMDWEEPTGVPEISKNSAENENVQSNSD
ncbi:hypothetical protein ABEB36_011304 [Hypothenemus hampei]|uniref:Uncharacterized protein n=1 Tax=Hypothenemus hampei TaxID=57062 RepID=A0ABD1EEY5_HYPHA